MGNIEEGGHYKNVPNNREEVARILGGTPREKQGNTQAVFSVEEARKLQGFQSTVHAANKAERILQNGERSTVTTVDKHDDIHQEPLAQRHVSQMNHAAFDLYYDHFQPIDRLRTAATDIVTQERTKAEQKQREHPEVKALNTIWELSASSDMDDEERIPR